MSNVRGGVHHMFAELLASIVERIRSVVLWLFERLEFPLQAEEEDVYEGYDTYSPIVQLAKASGCIELRPNRRGTLFGYQRTGVAKDVYYRSCEGQGLIRAMNCVSRQFNLGSEEEVIRMFHIVIIPVESELDFDGEVWAKRKTEV